MDQRKIGAFIKETRKELGLTQSQLAEKLNISNKAISKWETGGGMPDVSLIAPLCEALNITSEELFAGERDVAAQGEEAQPEKPKKRYDTVAFVIVFIFIAVILVFLIMLSKKVITDKDATATSTASVAATNEATPTNISTPTETGTVTSTASVAATNEATPTNISTPTETGTATSTATVKPTPTPVWREKVIELNFENEGDIASVTSFQEGKVQIVEANGGRVLEYSQGKARWHSPAILYGDKLKSNSTYLFECDIYFDETPEQSWNKDKNQISIPLFLRNSTTGEYSAIAVMYTPNEEKTWFHVSAVLDISNKKSYYDADVDYYYREAKYENFDVLCYDTIIDANKQNTVLIDNIVITRES